MSQKLLVFDVGSSFGFFLLSSTTTSGLTHSVIPRSAIEGLVGAILGLQSDEYPEKLGESKIAVQILSPIRKHTVERNFIHETWLDQAQMQMRPPTKYVKEHYWQASQELLVSPEYRIYFSNPEVDSDLESFLANSKARFIPYLGKSSMIAWIRYRGKYAYEKNSSNKHVEVSSVIPFFDKRPDIKPDAGGVKISIDSSMSFHITKDRISQGTYSALYSENLKEIPVRGVEIYKITMNGTDPNIVFLPTRV
jgi:CRISPR-associated protein Cas5h